MRRTGFAPDTFVEPSTILHEMRLIKDAGEIDADGRETFRGFGGGANPFGQGANPFGQGGGFRGGRAGGLRRAGDRWSAGRRRGSLRARNPGRGNRHGQSGGQRHSRATENH